MQDQFRLALLGAGMITQGSHLPAALESHRIKVAAIIDPAPDRARRLAASYGIDPIISERVDDVFGRVDGALIATPNGSHRELAVRCLDAGISTLIEKPIAVSVEEGNAICDAATRAGRVAAVGYSTRFRESTILLKELLDSGYFGRVKRFAHQFGTPGGWAPLSAYNLKRNSSGGGVLMVTATHFLDRMLHFWGAPHDVEYEDDSEGGPEANCIARFAYRSGEHAFSGVAVYSKTCSLPGGMVIETERGQVKLADSDDAQIAFVPNDRPGIEQIIRRASGPLHDPTISVFRLQLEDFVMACVDGVKPMVDAKQGTESMQLIERLYGARKPMRADWRGTSNGQSRAVLQ